MMQAMEAEQSVIGALLLERTAWEAVSDEGLKADDFADSRHKLIYQAIEVIAEKGEDVDIVTVGERLKAERSEESAGGLWYLQELIDTCPAFEHAKTYASRIVEASRKRKLANLGYAIGDMVQEGGSPSEIEDHISSELMRINQGAKTNSSMSAGRATQLFIDKLQSLMDGDTTPYTTGLKELDKFWQPEPGRLYVIAGRPKMGKTTLSQMIIEANAMSRTVDGVKTKAIPVYQATMEMPAPELANRHIASLGRVDRQFFKSLQNHPRAEEMWSRLSAGATRTKDLCMEIDYCPGATPNDIVNRSRAWFRSQEAYREDGLGMLVVDHLGLISLPGKGNTAGEVGEVTKRLKNLAGELKIPVILLCQLNRGVEQRPNKRPVLSDLRDSGRIEEDADVVCGVYRDEVYNEDSPDKGVAELITLAWRDGETGTARVQSNLKYSRFDDLAPGHESHDY